MDIPEIPTLLRAHGIALNTSLGQHFLVDSSILEGIISHSSLNKDIPVVEVGCGAGVLTAALLNEGCTVHGFELDPRMVKLLRHEFALSLADGSLVLHEGDALRQLPEVLPSLSQYQVVANVPYQITSPLLERFLEPKRFGGYVIPTALTLLVQRELGERIAAPAGHSARGYLSVLLELQGSVQVCMQVPPTAFLPPPAVDSVVIRIEPYPNVVLDAKLLSFIRTSFQQRRKQLKNVIAGIRGVPSTTGSVWLREASLPETARAQELTSAQWLRLYQVIHGELL
jgi:16S rRNA (adenine1518-N6/adenine1519-N6)-dimethyltransferase